MLNHAKPYLLLLLVSSFLAIFAIKSSRAADQTITCDSTGCTGPGSALFNETNAAPGYTVSKTLEIKNLLDEPLSLNVTAKKNAGTDDNFLSQVSVSLDEKGGANKFLGNLGSFLNGNSIDLGALPASNTKEYQIALSFNQDAGNDYQGKTAKFDISINATGETGGGKVLGAAGAPVCGDTTPQSSPTLSVLLEGENTILLGWTPVEPVTHYMIRYGKSAGVYIYGATNVGNVNEYSVEKLSGGNMYYFQVAGVNGCAPGLWSNEARGITYGPILPSGPAVGFTEQILGTQEEKPQQNGGFGIVEGVFCTDRNYAWWIPLVGQVALGVLVLGIIKWKKKEVRYWLFTPILLAALSQIVHHILGCNCATGIWCTGYWIFNLNIFVISMLFYFLLRKVKFTSLSSKI